MSRSYSGAGLGLSIVTSLMKLHGGSCHIDSEKSKGTTVILHFPPQRTIAQAKHG